MFKSGTYGFYQASVPSRKDISAGELPKKDKKQWFKTGNIESLKNTLKFYDDIFPIQKQESRSIVAHRCH